MTVSLDGTTVHRVSDTTRTFHLDPGCVKRRTIATVYSTLRRQLDPWACRRCALVPLVSRLVTSPPDRQLLVGSWLGNDELDSWQRDAAARDAEVVRELGATLAVPVVEAGWHVALPLDASAELARLLHANLLVGTVPAGRRITDTATVATALAMLDSTSGADDALALACDLALLEPVATP